MKLFHRIALTLLTAVAAFLAIGATTSAIYLHHQQSTLAALEADLQNREIGLDFANKSAVGKFTDGSKFHLISQEMPNAALTGTLNVTGNTTLGANLTLSARTVNQPLWTNGSSQVTTNAPTGTGTTLVLSASPTLTGTLTGSAANFSSTLGVTGLITAQSALTFASNTSAVAGSIWKDATGGLKLRGVAGSTWDFVIVGPGLTADLGVPTGTNNVSIPVGSLTVAGSVTGASFSSTGTASVDSIISAKFYQEGSFTGTVTGCATAPTVTVNYVRVGKMVTMTIPNSGTLTSNAATFGYSGLPAALSPTTTQTCVAYSTTDNGVSTQAGASIQFSTSSTISFLKAGGGTSSWTSSGNKQMFSVNCSYILL